MTRNEKDRVCFVVNPRSAGGATGRRLGEVKDAAGRAFATWEVRTTRHPGHATELAAAAAREGFDLVVAVGGDGTANEVVNGLMEGDQPVNPKTVFSVVPAGTGSDLIKTLGIPKAIDDAMAAVAAGEDRASDVVAVDLQDDHGAPVRRCCVNVAGFGIEGEVVTRANASKKRFGGLVTFFGATVAAVMSYTPPRATLRWVDERGAEGGWEGELWSAFVANGAYCGGGMWVGPNGSMQDGLVDVSVIPKISMLTAARHGLRLYDGSLAKIPGVVTVSCRRLEATAPGAIVRADVDGEQPGVLPATFRVLPQALVVRGLWKTPGSR